MRNKNITQERRYKNKFEKRLKAEEYMIKLNNMMDATKNIDTKGLDFFKETFDEFKKYSTKGLSARIRKLLVSIEQDIIIIEDCFKEGDLILLGRVKSRLLIDYIELKQELIDKIV